MRFCSLRFFWITLLIIAVTGCATRQASLTPEAAAKIKRIAVVSVVGGTFTRTHVGMTVFGNETEQINIADWKIDEQYEKQFGLELQRRFRLNVVRAPYFPSAFAPLNEILEAWQTPGNPSANWSAVEQATRKYCTANLLDALLIVGRNRTTDFLGHTNQVYGGAGIYTRGTPFLKISMMHLISKLVLIDCATAQPLAVRVLEISKENSNNGKQGPAPLLQLDFDEARVPISDWSTRRKQKAREDLASLPNKAIVDSLKSIFISDNQ